ncbi:GtrA family protein [Anaeromicropila herbilytica]|uniref:Membrane protein n=1 Tax=Anaeromicropila herbilytica TaxID=2785025 RepID=A0A7R7IDY6_9FIRM|nr:GtrA family protein [Anaeromicropila herbilytica]BCN32208.1 membrane protein [Anaeromicropila herbilytica]
MKALLCKYKEILLYLIFGGLTTVINIITYYIFARVLGAGTMTSTVIAFILSVIFAYVTNKIWVFDSKTSSFNELLREATSFFGGRLFSGGCDLFIMFLFVDVFHFNDMIIKILSNIMVVIMNYVISKLFVFKGEEKIGSKGQV